MPGVDVVGQIVPVIETAIGAYGAGVLTRAEDDMADATIRLGQRLLGRVLRRSPDRSPIEAAVRALAAAAGDPGVMATLAQQIRQILENDEALLAELAGLLSTAASPEGVSVGGDLRINVEDGPAAAAVIHEGVRVRYNLPEAAESGTRSIDQGPFAAASTSTTTDEFSFTVDTLRDRQAVTAEDLPLRVDGRYAGNPPPVWVVLEDLYGQYYLQNPPVRFQQGGRWCATNILPGDGIMFVHFVATDDKGKEIFNQMVARRQFGAFRELPPGSRALRSIEITRI